MKRGVGVSESLPADGSLTIFWLLHWCVVEVVEYDRESSVVRNPSNSDSGISIRERHQ
jgi:hypothetical protein